MTHDDMKDFLREDWEETKKDVEGAWDSVKEKTQEFGRDDDTRHQ